MLIPSSTIQKNWFIQPTFILLLVCCLSIAKSYATKGENLEGICQRSPAECLEKVNIELHGVKEKSRIWFSLMQLKLSSLFILQKSDELLKETKRWISEPDLPIPFQVSIFMYYAKSCVFLGDTTEGKRYIHKAKQQLALMNEAYPSPVRLIEIANLQMYIGEFTEAYESLNTLKVKYKNSNNPHFMMELYGHLGHASLKLENLDESLKYWYLALPWSYKNGNEQQISAVLFNLAQAQHRLKKYTLAEQNYLTTIVHAEQAKDLIKASHAKLYLAEIKLITGDKKQAKFLLLSLDINNLFQGHLKKFNELKSQL
jgi:tetratricopeptide (TPR) repeat protein